MKRYGFGSPAILLASMVSLVGVGSFILMQTSGWRRENQQTVEARSTGMVQQMPSAILSDGVETLDQAQLNVYLLTKMLHSDSDNIGQYLSEAAGSKL